MWCKGAQEGVLFDGKKFKGMPETVRGYLRRTGGGGEESCKAR